MLEENVGRVLGIVVGGAVAVGCAVHSAPSRPHVPLPEAQLEEHGAEAYAASRTNRPQASSLVGFSGDDVLVGAAISLLPAAQAGSQAPRPTAARGGASGTDEMVMTEARLSIHVTDVPRAVAAFRAQVAVSHGTVSSDESQIGTGAPQATVVARVPANELEALLAKTEALGVLRARNVKAHDVGKEYFDQAILVRNLEATLHRLEDFVGQTKDVTELLKIEPELARVRTELDRVNGQMQYLKDHVERSTLSVLFFTNEPDVDVLEPEARMLLGARTTTLIDFRDEGSRYGYAGGGFTFGFRSLFGLEPSRGWTLSFDAARTAFTDRPPDSNYAYTALLAVDTYSQFFGNGHRTFMNPFFGWRLGYAHSQGRGDFAAGPGLGLDLLKTKAVLLTLQASALVLAGSDRGLHIALVPSAGAAFGF